MPANQWVFSKNGNSTIIANGSSEAYGIQNANVTVFTGNSGTVIVNLVENGFSPDTPLKTFKISEIASINGDSPSTDIPTIISQLLAVFPSGNLTNTITQLATPKAFTSTGATGTTISMAWLEVPNANLYTITRASNEAFTDGLATVYTHPENTFTDTGLTAGTTYWYRVLASGPGYLDSPYATGSFSTTS